MFGKLRSLIVILHDAIIPGTVLLHGAIMSDKILLNGHMKPSIYIKDVLYKPGSIILHYCKG